MAEPVLDTREISIRFGAVVGADRVSIAVAEGEVVGVIGANGAGKTTFINMVTGYLKPSSGRIYYMGRDVTRLSPRQVTHLGIRRSFQIPQIFPEMTAVENLLAALSLVPGPRPSPWRPLRQPAAHEDAERVLETFRIAGYAGQRAGNLPQGVKKVLDIAMATVGEPRLMLLDEPTSGVSAEEKFGVMETLMAALERRGTSVLFVEHDMEIVERHAQRVVAFYEGRVIADGPVDEVLSDPDVRRHVIGKELHRAAPRARGGG